MQPSGKLDPLADYVISKNIHSQVINDYTCLTPTLVQPSGKSDPLAFLADVASADEAAELGESYSKVRPA